MNLITEEYTVRCTMYTVKCTMYTVKRTMYICAGTKRSVSNTTEFKLLYIYRYVTAIYCSLAVTLGVKRYTHKGTGLYILYRNTVRCKPRTVNARAYQILQYN